MADKCFLGCGATESCAVNVCSACYNEAAVKLEKAKGVLSIINYLAASRFPGKTNEDVLYSIQLLSFGVLEFIKKEMETE